MSRESVSHLEQGEWWGTFFPATDRMEDRVAGQLTYDPRYGLQLDFFEPFDDAPLNDCDIIFGVVGGADKSNLVTLKLKDNEKQILLSRSIGGNGGARKIFVRWAVFGFWLDGDLSFDEVCFSQSNLSNLIGSHVRDYGKKIYEKPNLWHSYNGGGVAIDWSPIAKYIDRDHFIAIHESNDMVNKFNDLESLFGEFQCQFMRLTEANPMLSFKSEKGISDWDVEIFCNDILYFLSMILNIKSFSEIVFVRKGDKIGSYLSSYLAPGLLNQIPDDKCNRHIFPINGKNCDLGKLFRECLEFSKIARPVSSSIRFGGTLEMHLVMFLTAMEAINEYDCGKSGEKYDAPIEKYLCAKGKNVIFQILKKNNEKEGVGSSLSKIRAKYVHIGVRDEIDVDFKDMVVVRDMLKLLVIKFVLLQTSLSSELVELHYTRNLTKITSSVGEG